ncbi:competence protein ComFB [Clostridium pascui]|uniref:late competence development ComFB family protein n=1 Tax=Clostridium pascui TaxID=46609 RepID=UPI00195EA784|nr:late competence development ComFB family protein [Clostridium pascui]MBM7871020.1 competence protein ComFB [Clostridium pascui]
MLKNYIEIVIDELLPHVLDKYSDICTCPRCVEDIKAIALNNLKPLYVATETGFVYAKVNDLRTQFTTDVIKELMSAIEIVSKNPRHFQN